VRAVPLVVVPILFSFIRAFAGEIREFDVRTLEKLGNELSLRDRIAAEASDLVFATHPDFRKVTPQGWVTDLRKNGDVVYWIGETERGLAAAYKVTFAPGSSPRVEDIHGIALPEAIVARYKARRTAIKAVLPKLNAAYDSKYNFEVLNRWPLPHYRVG